MARTEEDKRRDWKEKEARDKFQSTVKEFHDRIRSMSLTLFTVGEFERLLNTPAKHAGHIISGYSEDDLNWLSELEQTALDRAAMRGQGRLRGML